MPRRKPIQVGIAGLGRAGAGMHLKELASRAKKFQIVAVCDVIKARREGIAERCGCKAHAKIEDLIADPAVELVDIATRSPEHAEQAIQALRAGKTVFLEKPICLSHSEAKKIQAAAAKSKGAIYFRHNRRFEAAFNHIRQIIASGVLGEVYEIKLRRNSYKRRDDWQTLIRCGGGQLLNWGPHVIDHALQLLESPVAEMWSDLKRVAAVGDAEDHVRIILKGENERVVDLEISGGAAIKEPEYIVSGAKGALICQGKEIRLRYLDPKKKLSRRRAKSGAPPVHGGFGAKEDLDWIEKTIPVKPKPKVAPDCIWDSLYGAMRQGKPFPVTTDEAVAVMRIVSAAKKGTPFDPSKPAARKKSAKKSSKKAAGKRAKKK
jgi:scyllo-inositol 2-dehydrogenase (NADP+)